MTPKQRQTLATIVTLRNEKGYPPTIAEIAEAIGISESGGRVRVEQVESMGLITRQPTLARSIVLTAEGESELRKAARAAA